MVKKIMLGGLVLSAAFLTGCEVDGKVTGGGTMHSAGGDGKTVFSFNGQRCPDNSGESTTKGQVTFHDKTAIDFESVGGVDFHGTMTNAAFCSPEIDEEGVECRCSENQFQIEFAYRSTNNQAAGEGEGIACLLDFGKGNDIHGAAVIQVESGPYNGYVNVGAMNGQVNVKECPGKSE
ncbi:MAG: hypothetical protein HWE16_12700 [Gammaproteobacteria bacterium]|nr:hypothetical protein [Gammaproteobacteria bacterium]